MEAIRNEIHDGTNILYNYTIPLTILILDCILKRNELTIYKDSIYFIFFRLSAKFIPTHHDKRTLFGTQCVQCCEQYIISSVYDKYKPKGRKRAF